MTRLLGVARSNQALIALILVQAVVAMLFLGDIVHDIAAEARPLRQPDVMVELIANIGLIAGIVFEARYLSRLLLRQQHDARAAAIASGALYRLIEGWFADWKLTTAEADVALLAIKGLSIAEIAAVRGSAEATVKTHLNAIYRKSGVPGRAQLASLIVEELLAGPLVVADEPPSGTLASGQRRAMPLL